jgi:hypothetical protein
MFEYEVKFREGLVDIVVEVWVTERNPSAAIDGALRTVVRHSGVSFDVADCREVTVTYIGQDEGVGGG